VKMIGGVVCTDVIWKEEKREVLAQFMHVVMTYFLGEFEMIRKMVWLYQNCKL